MIEAMEKGETISTWIRARAEYRWAYSYLHRVGHWFGHCFGPPIIDGWHVVATYKTPMSSETFMRDCDYFSLSWAEKWLETEQESRWTNQAPTEPGLYWVRWKDESRPDIFPPEVVQITPDHWSGKGMGVDSMGIDVSEPLCEFAEDNDREWWPEPLTPPETVTPEDSPVKNDDSV